MGRGCFQRLSRSTHKHAYLVAKGVGPGPGSEAMRQMLDETARAACGRSAGCLRLETGCFYPLLVKFLRARHGWEFVDPRPEGFCGFGNVLREAESSAFLTQLGLPVVAPLILLRHKVTPPWATNTRDGVERYLMAKMPASVDAHLRAREGIAHAAADVPVFPNIGGVEYRNMDGGILVRAARSPFRLANLEFAAASGDHGSLSDLVCHCIQQFGGVSPSKAEVTRTAYRFTHSLARTAARLFCEGVLHSQLHLHFQNVSLAAELADFDCTIFVRASLSMVEDLPFPAPLPVYYDTFWQRIRSLESSFDIDLMTSLAADYQRVAGLTSRSRDDGLLAASMLQQILDLQNHATRGADLLLRLFAKNPSQAGTILEMRELEGLRQAFRHTFLTAVDWSGGSSLLQWCRRYGADRLCRSLRSLEGRRSTYGWWHEDVPVDTSHALCDPRRVDSILGESAQLLMDG